jgi:exodeoxyribonuclease-3
MAITLATWNVNSLKVRLPHLLGWLGEHAVDIVCLQETKLTDDRFPQAELQAAGYRSVFAGQKTYNGIAILMREATTGTPRDIQVNLPGFEDEQKRLLALTFDAAAGDSLRVVCGYFPNGQAVGTDKYDYKLRWLAALTDWLRDDLTRHAQLALLGDYNIAPEDRDCHEPAAWVGQVLFSEPEKAAFRALIGLGLTDSFRLFAQPERSYSWWDYRNLAFRRKMGMRIDHILLSQPLATRCTGCTIDVAPRRLEQPSDHAPVVATIGPAA